MAGTRNVDEYLAALPDDRRGVLEELRRTIRAAAPDATETVAYNMPAYRVDGHFLVSFEAYKNHFSLFPASEGIRQALGDELKPYFSGKGTIRFSYEQPVPTALVEQIVRLRLEETGAKTRLTGVRKELDDDQAEVLQTRSSHAHAQDR